MSRYLVLIIAILCIGQLAVTFVHEPSQKYSSSEVHDRPESLSNAQEQQAGLSAAIHASDNRFDNIPTASPTLSEREASGVTVTARNPSAPLPRASAPSSNSPSRPDPFAPFFAVKGDSATRSPSSLTEIDLRDVRVTAILRTGEGNTSASIETPQGHSFLISVGSIVGTQRGRVVDITPAKVVISESTTDKRGPGPTADSTTVLELRTKRD